MTWTVHRIYGYHRPDAVDQFRDEQDARMGYLRKVAELHIGRVDLRDPAGELVLRATAYARKGVA